MTIDELYKAFEGPINGVIKNQQDLYNGVVPILGKLIELQNLELTLVSSTQEEDTELEALKAKLEQIKVAVQKASASKLKTELKTILGI